MNDTVCSPQTGSTYREHIARLARDLVPLAKEGAQDSVSETPDVGVQLFIDGNLEKRADKLRSQLEFVAGAFSDFERLIDRYMGSNSAAAYDTALSDGERMLRWIQNTERQSPEQQDFIACQRARHAVEELARANRLAHVRFQERYSLVERWLADFSTTSNLKLYLNPMRSWTRFVSPALLDEESVPPAHVLFFAQRDEIGSAVLELEGQALVNELADFQPCTLAEWAAISNVGDIDELCERTCELAAIGLVALG